jgi:heat shock protein HslJ
MRILNIIIISITLVTLSCEKAIIQSGQLIENTEWKLVDIPCNYSSQLIIIPKEVNITISFYDKTISGKAVCNRISGTFNAEGISIKISCGRTKMGCGKNMDLENIYYENLNKAKEYAIWGDSLFLFTSGKYNLIFEKINDI